MSEPRTSRGLVPGLLAECHREVLLLACGQKVPSEDDFSAFLLVARTGSYRSVWVHTTGGYYNAIQRKRAAGYLSQAKLIAIMTDSVAARGAVTAFSWLRPGVRAFGGSEFTGAAQYLGATQEHAERLQALMKRIR